MPIGGFVVMADINELDSVVLKLKTKDSVEVFGADKDGNIVVVIYTENSEEMEDVVRDISLIKGVFSVGLTYLYAEDEVKRIERGEYVPKIKRKRGFFN